MQQRALSCVLLCLTFTAGARSSSAGELSTALEDWRTSHGSRWSAKADATTGRAELIYGGRATWPGVPVTDEDWIARAQIAIAATHELHGVAVDTLVASSVHLLPLGMIGSGDKWSVDLRQEIGGLPVHGGTVAVLFDATGSLLSVHAQALTDVERLENEPRISANDARDTAVLAFEKEFGTASHVSEPVLVILPIEVGEKRMGRLAWDIDVQSKAGDTQPDGRRYWVDARSGHPLRDETSVHSFDISGTITTFATPGTRADSASNPETQQPAKYMRVQHSGGVVHTDAAGNFTIPGAAPAQNVTLSYSGLYADVDDEPTGTPYSQVVALNPGPGNNVVLNSPVVNTVTSQANIFNHVSTVRDYIRRITPTDATADRVFTGHANIADTCNAYYDGVSINFFAAGGNCNNTAFSTVVAHELGHWLNVLYGTGNGSDGMGEGNGDVFALYVFDTALNGEGFFTNGGAVRSGNNTRQFCGDCNPGCYGGVHADGEVWMGAAWKIRVNLNNALGNVAGDLVADELFMGWMNAYNQTQIRSIIELQWLILDDDDANLSNGTPHGTQIEAGFRAQGFPGYEIEFSTITTIADQTCEASSYPVTANVSTVQGTTITAVTLTYRVQGGPWIDVAMAPLGGTAWRGSIPYVASPATVEYKVRAVDSGSNAKDGLCSARSFFIGQTLSFAAETFEAVGGWTNASVGDTSNANNDWQRGNPVGNSGTSQSVPWADPVNPSQGSSCWGNDLGIATASAGNGAYQANVHNYLRSPVFDCTGQTGVQLIFKRWLTVEESQFDIARVLVNNTEVWRNPASGHVLDTAWTAQAIDISAVADGVAAVTVQFELQSDGGLQLGGWQIDDLKLGRIVAAAQCTPVLNLCAGDGSGAACPCANNSVVGGNEGCRSSLGFGGRITASGTASVSADTLVLSGSQMPWAPALYYQGTALQNGGAGLAFGDGLRCVSGTVVRLATKTNTPAGTSQFPAAGDPSVSVRGLVPAAGGTRAYQAWYRNAAAFCTASTFNLTNGLSVAWAP